MKIIDILRTYMCCIYSCHTSNLMSHFPPKLKIFHTSSPTWGEFQDPHKPHKPWGFWMPADIQPQEVLSLSLGLFKKKTSGIMMSR